MRNSYRIALAAAVLAGGIGSNTGTGIDARAQSTRGGVWSLPDGAAEQRLLWLREGISSRSYRVCNGGDKPVEVRSSALEGGLAVGPAACVDVLGVDDLYVARPDGVDGPLNGNYFAIR